MALCEDDNEFSEVEGACGFTKLPQDTKPVLCFVNPMFKRDDDQDDDDNFDDDDDDDAINSISNKKCDRFKIRKADCEEKERVLKKSHKEIVVPTVPKRSPHKSKYSEHSNKVISREEVKVSSKTGARTKEFIKTTKNKVIKKKRNVDILNDSPNRKRKIPPLEVFIVPKIKPANANDASNEYEKIETNVPNNFESEASKIKSSVTNSSAELILKVNNPNIQEINSNIRNLERIDSDCNIITNKYIREQEDLLRHFNQSRENNVPKELPKITQNYNYNHDLSTNTLSPSPVKCECTWRVRDFGLVPPCYFCSFNDLPPAYKKKNKLKKIFNLKEKELKQNIIADDVFQSRPSYNSDINDVIYNLGAQARGPPEFREITANFDPFTGTWSPVCVQSPRERIENTLPQRKKKIFTKKNLFYTGLKIFYSLILSVILTLTAVDTELSVSKAFGYIFFMAFLVFLPLIYVIEITFKCIAGKNNTNTGSSNDVNNNNNTNTRNHHIYNNNTRNTISTIFNNINSRNSSNRSGGSRNSSSNSSSTTTSSSITSSSTTISNIINNIHTNNNENSIVPRFPMLYLS